jgi:hypothetical protein
MEAKEFYKSKTFWINVIAFAIAFLRFVTKQAIKLS